MQVYWEEAIAPIVEKRRKQQAMGKWDQRLKRAKAEQQVTLPPAELVAFLLWTIAAGLLVPVLLVLVLLELVLVLLLVVVLLHLLRHVNLPLPLLRHVLLPFLPARR